MRERESSVRERERAPFVRERERALHIGRTFSLRAETEDDDGRVFFFL